jgi:uncharacterized OsmC-like protein
MQENVLSKDTLSVVRQRQDPLRARYRSAAGEALITDCAHTIDSSGQDPFHGVVVMGEGHGHPWRFGIHRAVGGYHDLANPGDILCAALAACLDSTLRIIADRLDIRIESLNIETTVEADARGTLLVDRSVPVAFQRMESRVRLRLAEPDAAKVQMLMAAAEHSCVVLQTLRGGVSTSVHIAP